MKHRVLIKHYQLLILLLFSCSAVSNFLQLCGLQMLKFAQIHVHWVGDVILSGIPLVSHPLSPLLLLPSTFPNIRVFSNESALCISWPPYWSFSFNISPSNEHPGVISFKMDWFSSVQSLSRVRLFATPWIIARQASLSITNSRSSLILTSIESVIPSSHLILCRPLFLLPPIPPSIRVFSSESTLHMRWPKYWSFSFSIIPSKEYPGLISFIMDWLDLLAVQGTLKSLLQHHSSKASILQHSAFFTVQLSHPYMTTGKAIALTRGTLLAK